MRQAKISFLTALLLMATIAAADEVDDNVRLEQERQAAFRAGFATIVDSLNTN